MNPEPIQAVVARRPQSYISSKLRTSDPLTGDSQEQLAHLKTNLGPPIISRFTLTHSNPVKQRGKYM